eukprot:9321525-Lingulodinium_polyedra.AAC.1
MAEAYCSVLGNDILLVAETRLDAASGGTVARRLVKERRPPRRPVARAQRSDKSDSGPFRGRVVCLLEACFARAPRA